jgi:hypothetical protein
MMEDGCECEWDGDRNDRGVTRTTKEKDENYANEADALENRVRNLVHRRLDEIVTIDVGDYPYILRRKLRVQLLNLA